VSPRRTGARTQPSLVARLVPVLVWLPAYRKADLGGDLTAGAITAIMLVPQAMAYALLAGLPPEVGLYASIAPPFLYAIFGSSRTMAVGPVAVASLMVASGLSSLATPGSPEYVSLALILAAMVGTILVVLGLLRAGVLANFLSHSVLAGFTSAAAILIALSQVKHLIGVSAPRGTIHKTVTALIDALPDANPVTAAVAAASIVLLLLMRKPLARLLQRLGVPQAAARTLTKTGPLLAVVLATAVAAAFGFEREAHVAVVGTIPQGLPRLAIPAFDAERLEALAGYALLIAAVGFVESVSIARVLASRRRQKVDANQELVGLGVANLGAAFTGGQPVAGGFARSAVNFEAGAQTQFAAVVTVALIALAVMFFTPALHDLPQAVLAAIIVVSIVGLIDLHAFRAAWRYDKADFAAMMITFLGVLVVGVEHGIVLGVLASLALYLWRTSRPHIAVVGRVGTTEHFRNVLRHKVHTLPHVHAVRVDESLYFANTGPLEDHILAAVADDKRIRHVLLICSAVNMIDASALEALTALIDRLRDAGVTLHLAEVKGPVMDRLERSDLLERLKPGRVFLSTHEAMAAFDRETQNPAQSAPTRSRSSPASTTKSTS
jgi:SulP family sulfate permease